MQTSAIRSTRLGARCPRSGMLSLTACAESYAEIHQQHYVAVSQPRGCGKLRHIRIGHLWIQEHINDKDLGVRKIAGEVNPSDLMTKHLAESKMLGHCALLNFEHREGRATASVRVQHGIHTGHAKAV